VPRQAERAGGLLSSLSAVPAALGAALVFGVSSVAEQRGTKRVKRREGLSPKILLDLVREPVWLTGIAATLVGFALQVVALSLGPLALVEPILVCDLIFAVLISASLRKRWDPIMLGGVAACAAGVAGFLAISQPSAGKSTVGIIVVLPLGAGFLVAVAGCLAVAHRSKSLRPLALALACGICYGVSAFLIKIVTAEFGSGLSHLLTNWPIYALAVIGPAGFLLNQYAFQQGTLLAPVMSIIIACDPLVSILLGHLWLGETLKSSPAAVFGAIATLLLMVFGVVVLAHHAPQVMQKANKAAQPADAASGTTAS
jgi:drug/metabolite transporter (DMT)-like permease